MERTYYDLLKQSVRILAVGFPIITPEDFERLANDAEMEIKKLETLPNAALILLKAVDLKKWNDDQVSLEGLDSWIYRLYLQIVFQHSKTAYTFLQTAELPVPLSKVIQKRLSQFCKNPMGNSKVKIIPFIMKDD